jgi:hypothetical protein
MPLTSEAAGAGTTTGSRISSAAGATRGRGVGRRRAGLAGLDAAGLDAAGFDAAGLAVFGAAAALVAFAATAFAAAGLAALAGAALVAELLAGAALAGVAFAAELFAGAALAGAALAGDPFAVVALAVVVFAGVAFARVAFAGVALVAALVAGAAFGARFAAAAGGEAGVFGDPSGVRVAAGRAVRVRDRAAVCAAFSSVVAAARRDVVPRLEAVDVPAPDVGADPSSRRRSWCSELIHLTSVGGHGKTPGEEGRGPCKHAVTVS